MNWINPEQNLVAAVKQMQDFLRHGVVPDEPNGFTLQQCKDGFFKRTGSEDGADAFHSHYGSQKWLKGNGLPISNLDLQIKNWLSNPKNNQQDDKDDFMRKVMEDVEARDRRENKGIMASVNTRSNISSDEAIF